MKNVKTIAETSITIVGMRIVNHKHSHEAWMGLNIGESTFWISESSVMCKTPAGVHKSQQVSLTLGEQVISMSMAVLY